MSFRRFALVLLGCFALLMAANAALVYWVDPYDLFGRNWTGRHRFPDRETKPYLARSPEHRLLVLGSSKLMSLDTDRLCVGKGFNASLPGSTPEEMLAILHHALAGKELVLIGLDFFMFNEREWPLRPDEQIRMSMIARRLTYLFSRDAAEAALTSLRRYAAGAEPRYRPNGATNNSGQLRRHEQMPAPDFDRALAFIEANYYSDFRFSEARLEALREIKALLEAQGVAYRVFVNPLSDSVLALLERLPARRDFARFRRELRAIFPGLIDAATGTRFSADDQHYHFDPYHLRPEPTLRFVNEIVLGDLCGHPPDRVVSLKGAT